MNQRRVVVTGLGALTPLGLNVASTWEGLVAGYSGITTVTHFDASGFPCSIAGELKNFEPTDTLSTKDARRMDRFIQIGIVAASEAIADAGLEVTDDTAGRIGVYIGSGIGGVETIENTTATFLQRGFKRVSPLYIPSSIINMVSGNLSILYGFKGPNLSIATACTTGTHAIGDAGRFIAFGDADVMIAGGTEAGITATSMAGFGAARALSRRNDDPTAASRPWDRGRDGFVMGEGAGIVVLEELDFARRRGARIYAELSGFGMSADAHHITAPAPGGEGASRCMESAMRNGGINPAEVDYVNAHGTSTPQGDIAETAAIKRTFGDHAGRMTISSTKSMIGHLLGAAGGVEAISTILSLYHGVITPTINLDDPDPECDLDYVPHQARQAHIEVALSNSFGFGGTNGTLALRRFE